MNLEFIRDTVPLFLSNMISYDRKLADKSKRVHILST